MHPPSLGQAVVMGKQKSQQCPPPGLVLRMTSGFTPLMSLSTPSSSNVLSFFFSSFSPSKAQTPPTDPLGDQTPLPLHPKKTESVVAPQPSPLSTTELRIPAFVRLFISPKPNKSNFINFIKQAAHSAELEAARQREQELLNGACGRPSPALFLPVQGPAQSPPLPSPCLLCFFLPLLQLQLTTGQGEGAGGGNRGLPGTWSVQREGT